MNVIFCHPFDRDAIWLYLELKKQGVPIQLLAPEQVLMAREWTQSLGDGHDGFVITIEDGTTIKGGEIAFFFNRVQFVDAPVWRRATEGEREYVRSEMTAMLMSWLYQVQQQCLMINPPFGQSLCGAGWHESQWEKAAFDAGFHNIKSDPQSKDGERALVVGAEVITGSNNKDVAGRCARLAQIAQSPLLEVYMGNHGDTFMGATAMPAFRAYGSKFLSVLKQQLPEVTP